MNRRRSIPSFSEQQFARSVGFARDVPPRGRPDALAYMDTGVLLAVAASPECLEVFCSHYQGRLFAVQTVIEEVRRKAQPAAPGDPERLVRIAARLVLARMLIPGILQADGGANLNAELYDSVMLQLSKMPDVANETHHALKNAGEAMSITACIQNNAEGKKSIFFTNDRSASLVAQAREVAARNFRHVLRELVCAGQVDETKAFQLFSDGYQVSKVPAQECPESAQELACHKADVCAVCSSRFD